MIAAVAAPPIGEAPWFSVDPLPAAAAAELRRAAIFECCKWDPQVGDVSTIATAPLVLSAAAWRALHTLAEALAREVQAAEEELAHRPDLHADLGLPRAVRRALARPGAHAAGAARLVRFDFHHTTSGWRISEANTDVPGGLNEASGLPPLVARHYAGTAPAGDPARAYASALSAAAGEGAPVALVHATAYTDDRQVMTYLASRLAERGTRASLVSPADVRWRGGRALLDAPAARGEAGALARFFPGEWLSNLPDACGWPHFFRGAVTPISNPATALLTQSKRFPLTWPHLRTALPTWRALLPETRDPREAGTVFSARPDEEWVLKPVLGRVGEGIGMAGVTPPAVWTRIARSARWWPSQWVAQRRFTATPLVLGGETWYPGVGVYTIDGVAAGAYGRLARRPLVDAQARDAAVLVASLSAGSP